MDKGWNLFGYSGDNNYHWNDSHIDNSGNVVCYDTAANEGLVQSIIYYYEHGAYKLIPINEEYFQKGRGYWIYALEDNLILEIENVDSADDEKRYWFNTTVDNGTEIKTLEDAGKEKWLQSTIYYYDHGYKFVPGDDDYIYPWNGYWLYANKNLTLIIS